jgi:DNA invertase Pin-like site-specific DNA recombinase
MIWTKTSQLSFDARTRKCLPWNDPPTFVNEFRVIILSRMRTVTAYVASGMGDGAGRSEQLRQAVLLAKQNQWPLIVASLDRIVRDTKRFEEFLLENLGVRIISAKHGEDADPTVIRAAAERAQYEGERISQTTKKALAERKAKGVKLGNRTNLDEAQRKGAEKNRALGKHRRAEFEEMLRLARKAGAKSVVEITADLNARGFRTARGGDWKASNVHRMLKEIDAAPPAPTGSGRSAKPVPPPTPWYQARRRNGGDRLQAARCVSW